MRPLSSVLAVAALVIAVLGVTPVGEATLDVLPLARNADRVDMIHASRTPKAGQLYPLGKDRKFPPQVLSVTKGPKGDQGPIGPQGPQGLTGPQGPQGPAGATNVTLRTGEGYVPSLLSAWAWVTCPTGQRATGGGGRAAPGVLVYETVPTNATGAALVEGQTPVGWRVGVDNYNDQPANFTVYVLCASP
jgi:hypothetical protein